jgi:hypothetical protein
MADFFAKTGRTGPALTATLYNPNGEVANLSNGTIEIRVYHPDGRLLFSNSAVITDAPNGRVLYSWRTTDLTQRGLYKFEFVFYPNAGGSVAYPSDRHWTLEVERSG